MILEDISKGTIFNRTDYIKINDGMRVAIIGKNGQGKTTLLRIMAGNILPDKGKIMLNNEVYCFPLHMFERAKYQRKVLENVLFVENQNYLYHNLTCEQNIKYYMMIGNFDSRIFGETLNLLETKTSVLKSRVSELSLGTKQKLSIAFALSSQRPIVLIDEPTVGLDRDAKKVLENLLKQKQTFKKIVVSTNDVSILTDFDLYLLCEGDEVKVLYDNPYV